MLSDTNRSIKKSALKRILSIRKHSKNNKTPVRKFLCPISINFNAAEYFQMVDLKEMNVTEPPLIFEFTNNQIRDAIKTGKMLNFGNFHRRKKII